MRSRVSLLWVAVSNRARFRPHHTAGGSSAVNAIWTRVILGSVDVMVREGGHVDPYYRRGQGLQRSLYLSLLRALAARTRGEGEKIRKPFILLFEEAEAFLHPEGQGKMRLALEAISAQAQVVFTTHSPLMVAP